MKVGLIKGRHSLPAEVKDYIFESIEKLQQVMKLSVVIPAYNEEGIIDKTILSLTNALQLNDIYYEVVVVNDYSFDATADVIKKWLQEDPIQPNSKFEQNVRSYVRCYVRFLLGLMLGLLAPFLSLTCL